MNRIKDLREDLDMRQIDLAEATGIDQRTISNYETEKTYPDSLSLIKLADFFNVSIDYLVCRTQCNLFDRQKRNKFIDDIKNNLEDLKKY
jgi:transcriptional regulator with XRE-family HTH domain